MNNICVCCNLNKSFQCLADEYHCASRVNKVQPANDGTKRELKKDKAQQIHTQLSHVSRVAFSLLSLQPFTYCSRARRRCVGRSIAREPSTVDRNPIQNIFVAMNNIYTHGQTSLARANCRQACIPIHFAYRFHWNVRHPAWRSMARSHTSCPS